MAQIVPNPDQVRALDPATGIEYLVTRELDGTWTGAPAGYRVVYSLDLERMIVVPITDPGAGTG